MYDRWSGCYDTMDFPVLGDIYTVRAVAPDLAPDGAYYDVVQLEELCNPRTVPEYGRLSESWFWEHCFRPATAQRAEVREMAAEYA